MSTISLPVTNDELGECLARVGDTLALVRREAGAGFLPERERELDAHLRSLRALLAGDQVALAEDVIEAAKRALESAAPEAPLLMLSMTHDRLRAAVARQALWALRDAA